ncbi:MAG: Crp/Fnr family transcriptional regulator [Bacteroidales bacterium]|nr:MAG: Crp/Fnr family transcriptional regulator [Bacteroidales bacterium]
MTSYIFSSFQYSMKLVHNSPVCDVCSTEFNPIFKHLTKGELERFNYEKTCTSHSRGDIIYNESSRINGCYCVHSGIVKIYKTGIDGKEQIIRFAKPGDIIGYRSILSNELACTSAKILEDSILCYISSELLISLVKNNGNFSMEIMKLTCKELGEANAYITDIAQKTVRERLAEVLIHLKDNFGLDHENILRIYLTREELANIVGTATESVIRLLSEFKNDRLIELNGRKIKILDGGGLRKIANLF